MALVIQVLICVVLVIAIGTWLSQSADVIAEKSGLGRGWVGAILLAGATSLPELATGVSAITIVDQVDLAVGGIFGSCLFNLVILALLDIASGPGPLFRRAQVSHGLSAGLGSMLIGLAAFATLLAGDGYSYNMGWIGAPSVIILILYLISARLIAMYEVRRRTEFHKQEATQYRYEHIPAWKAYLTFVSLAAVIVVLGVWLSSLGEQVAQVTGLGESFVGALMLAAATSLPEVVASFAAIRLGAVDLAVSNVLGSNLLNIGILALYDLIYLNGDIWSSVNQIHVFAALAAMVMTAVAIVGLIFDATRRPPTYISWDALALIMLYIGGMYAVFQGG